MATKKPEKQIALFIDKKDYQLLERVGKATDRSVSWLIRKAIHEGAIAGWAKVQAGQTDIENFCAKR